MADYMGFTAVDFMSPTSAFLAAIRSLDEFVSREDRHVHSSRGAHLWALRAAAAINADQLAVVHLDVGGSPFHVVQSALSRRESTTLLLTYNRRLVDHLLA